MSALGSLFTEDFMGLLLHRSLRDRWIVIVFPKINHSKTIDLERVIEKAENIYNFYLDSNWEFRFIGVKIRRMAGLSKSRSGEGQALEKRPSLEKTTNCCRQVRREGNGGLHSGPWHAFSQR